MLGKIILYGVLMALVFEVLIRIFNLYFQYPIVTLNANEVVNYIPGQEGIFVTGNRKMNHARYHINESGFNSFHEFEPTKQDFEVALIGDSFIEGLHQNYDNSIGKKIEDDFPGQVQVYEYGFSGYDLADQLHLMHEMQADMDLIDIIVIYLKFDEDVRRDHYEVHTRANLENSLAFKVKREIKLLSYLNGIGLITPITDLPRRLKGFMRTGAVRAKEHMDSITIDQEYVENLSTLLETYPIDKKKSVFLINEAITSKSFIQYCDSLGYKYLDFGSALKASKENTVLKYDPMRHWNNHGRDVVAKVIADYISNNHQTIGKAD
jgi:hypothetical protein